MADLLSVEEALSKVREAAGSKSEIQLIPYDEAYSAGFEDMMRRVPSVERLRSLIDFAPTTPLEQIIQDVVEDQRQRLASGNGRKPASIS